MCNTWILLFRGHELSLEEFIHRCRRFSYIDFALVIWYLVDAILDSGVLRFLAIILCILYSFDGGVGFYLTDPELVYSFSERTFHFNTLMNTFTLALNITFTVLSGSTSVPFTILNVVTTIYKAVKCINLHRLTYRVREKEAGFIILAEPLV